MSYMYIILLNLFLNLLSTLSKGQRDINKSAILDETVKFHLNDTSFLKISPSLISAPPSNKCLT